MNEATVSTINKEIVADITEVTDPIEIESEKNESLSEADVTPPVSDQGIPDQAELSCEENVTENVTEDAPEESCEDDETQSALLPSVEELHAELARLRAELEETKSLHARMAAELGEFQALFPEVSVSALPESIWEQVRSGIPLAASYALYEKKCILHREHAAKINMQNAKKASGAAGKDTPAEYFSPDEVRAMSQSEVRKNYQKIMESMKKWNS